MKNRLRLSVLAAVSLALAACSEDRPAPVVHDTRVVHHYHSSDHSGASNNPSDFEPVERPATYSH